MGRRHRSEGTPSRVGGHRRHGRERGRAATPSIARLRASEPSPAPEPRPASRTGPTGPILRANPYPEVTDLICRLPLPTLVYRPEASYLGDRLRIWVRAGPKLGCRARAACVLAPRRTTEWHSSRPQQLTLPLRPMQLPASHVSRTGSGTRDAARTAALYGRPCYQHPFALRVASRVTAP